MAQYWEDWLGSTLDAAPTGWTARFGTSNTTYVVQEDVDGPAGRRLRISKSNNERALISMDAVDADADRATVQIKMLVRGPSLVGSASPSYFGGMGRGEGAAGNETGVSGVFGASGTASSSSSLLRRIQYDGGSGSVFDDSATGIWDTGVLYWLTVDLTGSTITVSLATATDPETTIRSFTDTVSITGLGWAGILSFYGATAVDHDILAVGIGTGGDPAPMSGDPTPVTFTGTVPNKELTQNEAMTPYDFSQHFNGDFTPFTYALHAGTLPTGLSLDANTGVLSGTPTTLGTQTGIVIRATDAETNTADTNTFDIAVVEAPAYDLLWDLDSASIDPAVFTVDNPETTTPKFYLKARPTHNDTFGGTPRWIHWHFGLTGVSGKTPTFEINTENRGNISTYHSSWRPVYTYDFVTWHVASGFTALTDPHRVVFTFDEAFNQDTVYIADHQIFRLQDFDTVASDLVADTSGLVSVSASANASGVIGTSPAENDELERAVGENEIYGFVLGDVNSATLDGAPKRWMLVDCGIHSGEILDGYALRGIIDYYLNGTGERADRLRANWMIGLYFCLTPNGRYGGHCRGNFRDTKDPNRDWGTNGGAFSLAESVIVRDAMLADLDGVAPAVGIALHTASNTHVTKTIYYKQLSGFDETVQDIWLTKLDEVDTQDNWARVSSSLTTTASAWYVARGAKVSTIMEFGTRQRDTIPNYEECGRLLMQATSETDAEHAFTLPTLDIQVVAITATGAIAFDPSIVGFEVGPNLRVSFLYLDGADEPTALGPTHESAALVDEPIPDTAPHPQMMMAPF